MIQHGSLKPRGYRPRISDQLLRELLDTFCAVEVAGTMWCGKTWTSLSFGESETRVGRSSVRRIVEADPETALVGARPHVIDEWQDVPALWDAVRDAVDSGELAHGSLLLTGSSTPTKDQVGHSGAGRIAKLRMRTMSLAETGESSGAVSLAGLFQGSFEPHLVQQGLRPLAQIICRGGWPALLNADDAAASRYLDAYFDAIFDVSMAKRGFSGGDARRVALALARTVGTSAKLETIGTDAFGEETATASASKRASRYVEAFKALYMIEEVPGWDAPVRSKSRLRVKPKRYFADPSLAANLLQVTPERLLVDGQLFGVLFEALCMHDLMVYASALPQAQAQPVRYYRDSDGLEVDAIIELRDGRWAGIEIKLGENGVESGFAALDRLRRKIARNPAARNPEPAFMAVLVGAGEFARYDAGADAYVVPLTALGA